MLRAVPTPRPGLRRVSIVAAALFPGWVACAGGPPGGAASSGAGTVSVLPAPAPRKPPGFGEIWDEVVSDRFSLVIPLPGAASWTLDDRTSPWWHAAHAATHSELIARTWSATRSVRRDECLEQARRWRPEAFPSFPDGVVEERDVRAPAAFEVHLQVGVLPRADGLVGYALALGRTTGRCYAASFSTHAQGDGAEAAVGDRLALIADRTLSRVRSTSIVDRIGPSPR